MTKFPLTLPKTILCVTALCGIWLTQHVSKPNKMAGLIGMLGKFDPKTETVSCYEERLLLLYLTANNIADDNTDRRKAIFLSEVGIKGHL